MSKQCAQCHEVKSLSEFSKHAIMKDGLRGSCKACDKAYKAAFYKTREGLASKIYSSQRSSSKHRGHPMQNYTKEQFKAWLFLQPNLETLYQDWVSSGYFKMLRPSVDRLDDYAPYSLDNIRLTTWQINKDKGFADKKAGINNKQSKAVNQFAKDGKFIAEHYSAAQANRITGVNLGSISSCCKDKLPHAGGFIWSFV